MIISLSSLFLATVKEMIYTSVHPQNCLQPFISKNSKDLQEAAANRTSKYQIGSIDRSIKQYKQKYTTCHWSRSSIPTCLPLRHCLPEKYILAPDVQNRKPQSDMCGQADKSSLHPNNLVFHIPPCTTPHVVYQGPCFRPCVSPR